VRVRFPVAGFSSTSIARNSTVVAPYAIERDRILGLPPPNAAAARGASTRNGRFCSFVIRAQKNVPTESQSHLRVPERENSTRHPIIAATNTQLKSSVLPPIHAVVATCAG